MSAWLSAPLWRQRWRPRRGSPAQGVGGAGGAVGECAIANGANSFADAVLGSFDSAIADGAYSTADAGGTLGSGFGSFDLAAAFGDMLHAIATGNFMTDIVP